jgi:hypothetical protein
MINIKFKDNICNHEPPFIQNSDKINYIRNLTPNRDGNVEVNEGDIVIYTNYFQNNIDPKAKINIALMMEGIEYHKSYYDYISNNNNNFDLVLTCYKKLLDRGENFKLNLFGTCSLHESYIKIWEKSEMCSTIVSNKNMTSGHQLRHIICDIITKFNLKIDIYGGNYKNLPYSITKSFASDHTPRHISNGKINALKNFRLRSGSEQTIKDDTVRATLRK